MAFLGSSSFLDGLVLGVLSKEDTYGYVLTQQVKSIMDISDSTLYPVLRRLLKEDYLTSYDKAFQGRNRRYYSITEKGRTKLFEYNNDWNNYKVLVDKLLKGEIDVE